jgi:probable rRNA maturation factor
LNRSLSKAADARRKRRREARRREFAVSVTGSTGREYFDYLRRQLSAAEKLVRFAPRSLSVALVGCATMSQLHEKFLNIPGPTDVLTFEISRDLRGRITSGEVIICVPEARRQAPGNSSTARKELLLYALHGMLHLSGFDDRTAGGHRAMHRKEDQILTRLGVGPVFSGGAGRRGTKHKDR